ncbi:MAG: AMP-binding protein [Hyphomonadaceae bacterium]|nr:AMP-binding protein [Hyphomonadaceae bacterium]
MRLYDVANVDRRLIGAVLADQAAHIGASPWLRSGDRVVTFAEANTLVNRIANGLAARGFGRGDILAMVMKPSIEVVLLALATARLGGIFQTISTDYHGAFLDEAILASQAKVLIIDHDLASRFSGDAWSVPLGSVFLNGATGEDALTRLQSTDDNPPRVEVSPFDPAQVWWSSGTTGKPKGIMHSHSSILFANQRSAQHLRPGDVLYSCTPVYLGSAWVSAIWPSLLGGVVAAIDPAFSVSDFWNRIRFYGATHFLTLGAMHMYLWQQPETPRDRDHKVRVARCIPLDQTLTAAFKQRFGIAEMPQVYGTSETYTVFEAPEDGTVWRGAAAGRPVPHYEVRLVDENDREVPPGQVGEICVRPREPGILFAGYFNAPDITVAAWRNLWHHTGDMAYADEEGTYYFADRKKDYIRHKGRNISMFEVENVVAKHPAIAQVAAFGVPSKELESESELMLCATLKAGANLTFEELAHFINETAPYYFVPYYMDFLENLPQNAHGRVTKNDLRERGVQPQTWRLLESGFKVRR